MNKNIFMLFSIMLSTCVSASSVNEMGSDGKFLIGLSAGPTWTSGNKTQTIDLQPDITKTYTADNNTFYFPSAELFVGWQKPLVSHLMKQSVLSQLGIAVAGAGNAKLTGDIWEDADPDFNNFNYSNKIKHAHVAIKGRLIGNCGFFVEPYISASAGIGFNRAYDYNQTKNC